MKKACFLLLLTASRACLGQERNEVLITTISFSELEKNGMVRPVFDSLLEATALEHNLVLVTRNVKNFQNSSVTILNPWED